MCCTNMDHSKCYFISLQIKKSEPKVVDMKSIDEIVEKTVHGGKVAFCRCWRSKTFPLCDGSHSVWNQESGDNIGPLVLKAPTN